MARDRFKENLRRMLTKPKDEIRHMCPGNEELASSVEPEDDACCLCGEINEVAGVLDKDGRTKDNCPCTVLGCDKAVTAAQEWLEAEDGWTEESAVPAG